MSVVERKKRYSIEEYLELEAKADFRSEYHDGEIYAMSGGTLNHSLISQNMSRAIGNAFGNSGCLIFGPDLAVHIEKANSFVYPDLSIVCDNPQVRDGSLRQLTNPILVVEVLSKSTEAFDRGGKFQKYQTLPSLKSYVLIDQWEPIVEVFHKDDQGEWRYHAFKGMDSVLALPTLNLELEMADIYARVLFEPKEQTSDAK